MVTDWRQDENNAKILLYSNGPGRVVIQGQWHFPTYAGAAYGQWLDVQNAMLIVEMKHRETMNAKEAAALEGAAG